MNVKYLDYKTQLNITLNLKNLITYNNYKKLKIFKNKKLKIYSKKFYLKKYQLQVQED